MSSGPPQGGIDQCRKGAFCRPIAIEPECFTQSAIPVVDQMLAQPVAQIGLVVITVEGFHDLATPEELERRHAADTILGGEDTLLVRIHVDQQQLTFELVNQLVEHRVETDTRPRLWGPIVDQDGSRSEFWRISSAKFCVVPS